MRVPGDIEHNKLLLPVGLLATLCKYLQALHMMQVTLAFPAVLERLELKAFEMCKMIVSFIRHEPTLLKELRQHLFIVEERILESFAWERGSSLYPLIALACSTSTTVRLL